MKKRNIRALIVGAATVGIALGVVAPASAATYTYPSGGTWWSGFNGIDVVSDFYNDTVWEHRASVTTSYAYQNSGWQTRGVWAFAGLQQSAMGNRANYDDR
jgi:hypothetical protein